MAAGVYIQDASEVELGGGGLRNTISCNKGDGIRIGGSSTLNVKVYSNLIGTITRAIAESQIREMALR